MSQHDHDTPLYPEPAIVVGVGRFGLHVLEQMGEDWNWLARTGGEDPSLKNLRLISVRSRAEVDKQDWSRPEAAVARVARAAGEDDMPTLAVHWAILRSMGLIRYRHGAYQFALPRDAGVVEKGDRHDTRRRRYFEWRTLDSDPLGAVEHLHQMADEDPEVDLFLTPIVERIFHGQSPRLLLHLIGRCRALLEGRDPSPWPWVQQLVAATEVGDDRTNLRFEPDETWWTEDDRAGFLDGLLPRPLEAWPTTGDGDDVTGAGPRGGGQMCIPRTFWSSAGDLATPLSPKRFLRVDWERSGWVTDELDGSDSVEFTPVDASLFRLGFFDHDATGGFDTEALGESLRQLGEQVHRGLLRIWLDLRHERDEATEVDAPDRHRTGTARAIEQCLEITGELVVAPLVEGRPDEPDRPGRRDDQWVDGTGLPDRPSRELREAVVETSTSESTPTRRLDERFEELGLHFEGADPGRRPLFRDLAFDPDDLDGEARLTTLRHVVNEETRHLVSFDHLKDYRKTSSRKPPRLTVYVVADMGEAFSRRSSRAVLRALQQELMRAYGPMFDTSREGFDRPLSIIPVIWTPHPADPFGGDHPEANRIEEAAILDAVHELRRWVQALPGPRCSIPQVFINSRVTDSSVLSLEDASRQTRDFLSFQIRNDLKRDSWLRQTAVGFDSDDLFSTFSCLQIDFPARRAREYLANRLGREALGRLRAGGRDPEAGEEASETASLSPPPDELVEPSRRKLRELTADAARRLGGRVDDRIHVDASTRSSEVLEAIDADFEDLLFERIHDTWSELSRNRGAMDEMIDDLRQGASGHLVEALERRRREADRLVEDRAARGGLQSARARLSALHDRSRRLLEEAESRRRSCQELCLDHDLPDPAPITGACETVRRQAEQKPDQTPIRVGLIFWAIMAPALGAPLMHGVARIFELHLSTGLLETVLGPGGWLVGGVLVFAPVYFLLRRHLREAVNDVRDALGELADTVRDVVEGPREGLFQGRPSIRSFFAARLRMTAALADRKFADHVHDRVTRDNELAVRLFKSIEIQERHLRRRAESLGVRPASESDQSERVDDDIEDIFGTGDTGRAPSLLSPERLVEYYRRHFPTERDVDVALPGLLEKAGGFERWRREACLSDTESILEVGRREFSDIVTIPVGAHTAFESEVGANLAAFVARHYSNIGVGAQFAGYEGFDADGMRRLADSALVVHPMLRSALEAGGGTDEDRAVAEAVDVIESPIRPNTAYMLSLVQGIHARTIDNLRRHETFYDRLELPDSATPWVDGPRTLVGRPTGPPESATGSSDRSVSSTATSTEPERSGDRALETTGDAGEVEDDPGGEER